MNKQLRARLAPSGYYKMAYTPGLWRYVTKLVQFTLVVDDFGVKYVGKENTEHCTRTIRKAGYELCKDRLDAL